MTSSKPKRGAKSDVAQPCSEPRDITHIYADVRGSLLRFAASYFKKTPHDVEDVVQEAFVKVIEAQRKREIRSPKAYLYETTKNLALNVLDKSACRLTDTLGDLLSESVISETPCPEDQFESRRRFELFCRAVRKLPTKRRRAFVLRRVYGLSQKEIAERMNISIKTVEAHLAKAIVQCTEYMDAMEAEPTDERGSRGVDDGRPSQSGLGNG